MLFGKEMEYWKDHDAAYTATEIYQNYETWRKTVNSIRENSDGLKTFLKKVLDRSDYEVILAGAGTSEFIGNSVFQYLNTVLDYKVKSYATTDIVACPKDYLSADRYTLLVSFARSGNSPESVAAVNIANDVCKNIYHLFITCNADGALAKAGADKDNCYVLNMPAETHDRSFAMTSSYTNMYLSCILAFMEYKGIAYNEKVEMIIKRAEAFLNSGYNLIEKIVNEFDYNRITFLGSNCLKGVAQESALKTCELTAGEVMTTYDSCMGFRHGPKSVVKNDSLSVIYISDDAYTRLYDADIAKEIAKEKTGSLLVVASERIDELYEIADYYISFDNDYRMDNVFLGLEYILVGQLLGLYKSISRGNTPDNPCTTGQVSRVVHGVNIYPYKNA